jgi:hypothetical protein
MRTFADFLTTLPFGKIRDFDSQFCAVLRSFGPRFHSEKLGIFDSWFFAVLALYVKGVHQRQPPVPLPKKKPSASAGSGGAFKCRSGHQQRYLVSSYSRLTFFSAQNLGMFGTPDAPKVQVLT